MIGKCLFKIFRYIKKDMKKEELVDPFLILLRAKKDCEDNKDACKCLFKISDASKGLERSKRGLFYS